MREERIPDERGEVVFYNLGKFSQVISDFEAIHYQSAPARSMVPSRTSSYRADDAYPRRLAGQPVRESGRGSDNDDPPGQGDGVACRVCSRAP